MIIKSKKHFSDDELIQFKKLKESKISSVNELNNKLFQKNTVIKFNCIKCGKEYSGLYRNMKNKTELLCAQCELEKANMNKYGVKNVFQTESCKSKIRESVKNKYGVECYLQTDEARKARKRVDIDHMKERTDNTLNQYCSKIEYDETYNVRIKDDSGMLHYQKINCTCASCGKQYITNVRVLQRCPACFPEDWMNGTSKLEKFIYEYISGISPYPVIHNAFDVLKNKELDIYIPDINLAFEVDGDYWHGCKSTDKQVFNDIKNHSGDKQKECYKKGIRLITIKECDFRNRPEVFKRFINDLVLPRRKIYARQCSIYQIDTKTARDFCEYYHVNGYRQGSEKYGLFYNNELICVAVFGKHPKHQYECMRLCYKTGYDITGGWAKIVKHFGKPFIHYVNLMYFMGEDKTGIGYRFSKGDRTLSRNTLQKHTQLYKYCKDINPDFSDVQNCIHNGFLAIFDCGNDIRFYNQSKN